MSNGRAYRQPSDILKRIAAVILINQVLEVKGVDALELHDISAA